MFLTLANSEVSFQRLKMNINQTFSFNDANPGFRLDQKQIDRQTCAQSGLLLGPA